LKNIREDKADKLRYLLLSSAAFLSFFRSVIRPTGCSRQKLHKVCHEINYEPNRLSIDCRVRIKTCGLDCC